MSSDFIVMAVIAVAIATPLTWWIMDKRLGNFAYRITISVWMFFGAGLTAVVIALITVSFQAIKAALANTAGALRSE